MYNLIKNCKRNTRNNEVKEGITIDNPKVIFADKTISGLRGVYLFGLLTNEENGSITSKQSELFRTPDSVELHRAFRYTEGGENSSKAKRRDKSRYSCPF